MFTQRGHNLIELMLTLVISCILLKLIFNIFIGANTAAQSISEIHTIQTNALTVIETLTRDIKQAEKITVDNNVLSVSYGSVANKYFLKNSSLYVQDIKHQRSALVTNISEFNIGFKDNGVSGDVTIKQKTWHFFIAWIHLTNRFDLHKSNFTD